MMKRMSRLQQNRSLGLGDTIGDDVDDDDVVVEDEEVPESPKSTQGKPTQGTPEKEPRLVFVCFFCC